MRILLTSAFAAAALLFGTAAPAAPKRPNFLVIIADDLGYSDLGAFGGEIDTPNLDALAGEGLRLTAFHTAPTCSPTRSMLISGTDNHVAGLGSMAELLAANQRGRPGYEGYLSTRVAALPEILLANGYRTHFSGKWHLGVAPEQDPHARGFQQSFALLQGGHNHFGRSFSDDPLTGATYREDGKPVARLPGDFYSSDYFATKLIDQLKDTGSADKPFFAWLAFTAPHWPLQAPPEDIAKYRGRYDAGYDQLRARRLKRQVELGLLPASAVAHASTSPKRWASLSKEEQRLAARDMEIYAAMVDRLDRNVGRVVAELKRQGTYENTIILFISDNGAEGMDVVNSGLGIVKSAFAGKTPDNSLANRGAASSYLSYGPAWAEAASAPSWLYKAYATEGGTRVPAILKAPGARAGTIAGGYAHVTDVVPTVLDLAQVRVPVGTFAGRRVEPITGKSWAPLLAGQAAQVYAAEEAVGTELFGSRSLRQGDWKITDRGDGQWRLFDVSDDPGETRDRGKDEPERLATLIQAYDAYAKRVGVIPPDRTVWQP